MYIAHFSIWCLVSQIFQERTHYFPLMLMSALLKKIVYWVVLL